MSNISVIYAPKNINQTKEKPMLNLDQFVAQDFRLAEVISSPILWRGAVYQSNADWLEVRIEKLQNHLRLNLSLLINTDEDFNTDNDTAGSFNIPYETLAQTYSKTVEEIKNTNVVYKGDGEVEYQDDFDENDDDWDDDDNCDDDGNQDATSIDESDNNYIKFVLFQSQDPDEWYEEFNGQKCLKLDNIILDLLNSCYGK